MEDDLTNVLLMERYKYIEFITNANLLMQTIIKIYFTTEAFRIRINF